MLRPALVRWDKAAAASAHRYVANSSAVARRISALYGIEAEILPPPPAVTPDGPTSEVAGTADDFLLCVSRLLPYKNVDAVIRAAGSLPHERLVIVGTGPEEASLRALAGPNVSFAGQVDDAQLRWLYERCSAVVAASHEDFGLTPLEAGSFSRPVAALRWGGFLDTIDEGRTGIFFDAPTPEAIADAIRELRATPWSDSSIRAHAATFSRARFVQRLQEIVEEELNT